jgi:hypothetical protein
VIRDSGAVGKEGRLLSFHELDKGVGNCLDLVELSGVDIGGVDVNDGSGHRVRSGYRSQKLVHRRFFGGQFVTLRW